jgi:hypothetical protein
MLTLGAEPTLPEEPSELVEAVYRALSAKDYDTVKILCHDDFVFTSNAHPEKLDCPVQHTGPANVRAYLELVRANWIIVQKQPGAPKPQALVERHPAERGYVYNVTVQVHMINRNSLLEFKGTKRQEWLIQDGKVSAMSQWLDCKQIDAMKSVPEFA